MLQIMGFQTCTLHAKVPSKFRRGEGVIGVRVERRQVKKDGLPAMPGARIPFLNYLSTEWSLL